jgi:clan AA aspartic protease
MIGAVNAFLEAKVPLVVLGPGGQLSVEAIIDSGFTEHLTLRPAMIASLKIPWLTQIRGQLADGSVATLDVYLGQVIWDGSPRAVAIQSVDAEPMMGVKLLRNHLLKIQWVDGGLVEITPFP